MVPKGWIEENICAVLERIIDYRGQSVPKSNTGIKLITAKNVRFGFLDLTEQEYISDDSYVDWMKRGLPQSGDILFTTEAPLGNACRFPTGDRFAVGQRTITLRTNQKLDSEYLLYYLLSDKGQRLIDFRSSGSTAKGIKSSEFKKLQITYPQLISEQRKIAKILSTWDKAITTTERLLSNRQQQKNALMQRLLTGKQRFAGFEGEWKTQSLGSLFYRVTTKNNGQSTNVVTISGQKGLIRQEEFFNKSVASEILDNYYLLKQGQFAYNKSYSIGYPMGAIKRLNRYDFGVVTTLYICFDIRETKQTCPVFFEQFFESGLLNRSLTKIAAEGGRAHGLLNVKPDDFFGLKVKIPDFDEQQKIASVLSAADTEITTIQNQLNNLKQQKKALMQQLLTGKRRVKVDSPALATQ